MAKVRLNIQMEESMKDYVEEQADRLGVSQSGFINMCVAHYKEQRDSIQAISGIKDTVYRLERLQKESKK
jgi:hypothetical protein